MCGDQVISETLKPTENNFLEKKKKTSICMIISKHVGKSMSEANEQWRKSTLKLAHCTKQKGQEKSSVTVVFPSHCYVRIWKEKI